MHNNSVATAETVSDLNSMGACDENTVNNHENSENLPNGPPSFDQIKETQENETKELSQTPGQRKSGRLRPRKNEIMINRSPRLSQSRSQEKLKNEIDGSVDACSQDAGSKEKNRTVVKKTRNEKHNNEFTKIKRHLRYLLNRMKYEQNLIDAYAGEGWKGQSLEKIKPEKELDRAKSDINRYKLKIRDLFKQIDASCEEGRIPESLYDSEGQIDSEDIFCAKCGQSEVRLDNDIILCDGACERGFHQFCLDPPLLKEQVPPGDEGWLCPACDCKADSVDLLNDYMGTVLYIEDSWEKVFPETASFGNKLDDNLGLPSDDSEDDDYNPDGPQLDDVADAEDSSSDESDFSSASEDLGAIATAASGNKLDDNLGLPSDDSEDDDFNPDRADSDVEGKIISSGSEFSSDSDDLGDVKNELTSAEEQGVDMSGDKEELPELNMENADFAPITAKRKVERLDYKKLHDETYGNTSSDSSDEEFLESESSSGEEKTEGSKKKKQIQSTPVRKTSKKLQIEGTSDKSGNKSSNRRIGEAAARRLHEAFKENHYPDRNARDILVKELNLTHNQVSKWFGHARWSFNHPGGGKKTVKSPSEPAENSSKQANEASSTTPKSRKRKTIADH